MGFPRGRVGEEPRGARDEINPLTLHLIPNHFRLARLHLPPDGQHHRDSDIHHRMAHASDAEEEGRTGASPPSPENTRIKIRRIKVDVNVPPTNKNRGGGLVCVYLCMCVFCVLIWGSGWRCGDGDHWSGLFPVMRLLLMSLRHEYGTVASSPSARWTTRRECGERRALSVRIGRRSLGDANLSDEARPLWSARRQHGGGRRSRQQRGTRVSRKTGKSVDC